jgi:hypothetical protein
MNDETERPDGRRAVSAALTPPVLENTEMVPAGAVTIGVEQRVFDGGTDATTGTGWSIHVFGTEDDEEYLRFDGLASSPHYHYITPLGSTRRNRYDYDVLTNGDFLQWVGTQLGSNIAPMLSAAGAGPLADRVDQARVADAWQRALAVLEADDA